MRNFEQPGRSPVYAPTGMASTSHPLATQVAIDILKAGGNAMDAAIAACAVQCVVEPQSTSVGGDCFCLYSQNGTDQIIGFNGSGRAPAAASLEYFQAQGIDTIERPSPHSVVVPGAIDAWCQLNRDYGSVGLDQLLAPAVNYARDGYPITPRVHRDIVRQTEFLQQNPLIASVFLPNGQAPAPGQRHKQPELAATLERIGVEGRDAFYQGEIARDMVEQLRSLGGVHTLDDFAAAKGNYVDPIWTEYRGYKVYECPPNGQGVIALLLLNMLANYAVEDNALSVDRIHLEIEACRQAYRARTNYVGDPDQHNIPVEGLLSKAYAQQLCDAINLEQATVPPLEVPLPQHQDTVYISVVDKDRNACSFINTLFWSFGSGIIAPKSGVVLTNRAQGFNLHPNSPNCIAPNKRPLHTIIPGMLCKDNRVAMSFGVMGGEYQAMGHAQLLTRLLDFGMDIQEAQDAPRFMVDPFTQDVEMESGIDPLIRSELQRRGHNVVAAENPIGGSQAVSIDWSQGTLAAGSDPRKDGCAIGY